MPNKFDVFLLFDSLNIKLLEKNFLSLFSLASLIYFYLFTYLFIYLFVCSPKCRYKLYQAYKTYILGKHKNKTIA